LSTRVDRFFRTILLNPTYYYVRPKRGIPSRRLMHMHQAYGPGLDAQTPFLESRHHYIRKVYRSRIMARNRKNGSGPEDISALEPRLAKRVLELLLERHLELHSEISELAMYATDNPDEFAIAAEIGEVIDALDEGDVLKRSGRRRGGYTEPEEAVAEALTETMEPYFNRLQQQLEKGNDTAALALCKAIVLSMYRFSKNEYHPLLELYEEYPSETADWAVRLWCTAGDIKRASSRKLDVERKFPPEFAKRHTPEWEWLLDES